MGMLELGKTRRQKWVIIFILTLLHVLSVIGVISIFVVLRTPQLPPLPATLLVVGTVVWLFTFVLIFVNVAYIYLKRD